MAKVKYREGDWFAVPLPDAGLAVGIVARANPMGALVGYFFGPRRMNAPELNDLVDLTPGGAVLVGTFGHLGLVHGRWPIIGRAADWDRNAWPMPTFVRNEELTGLTFRVFYDENDPNRVVREEQIIPGEVTTGPRDGLMGAGYVEEALARLLN